MAHHRSGAALIMAIVILAAMLMLGLPFLFSQSASLTGTRSFAHSQQAQSGRSTAEDLGIGAAYYIVRDSLPQTGNHTESTDLNNVPGGTTPPSDPRRRTLDLSASGHGFNPTEPRNSALLGVSLEDESGKLDPNHMDIKAWERLFEKVGIEDWDDGDDGPNGSKDDDTDQGQLAFALAAVRYDRSVCREGRITRFEQLLEAKPQPEGVRQALTRSELAQLTPFLTLASLGQAREGLVDLGTMIKYQASTNPGGSQRGSSNERLDTLWPTELAGFPVARDLLGAGSVVVSQPPNGFPPLERSAFGNYHYGMATSIDLENVQNGGLFTPNSYRPVHQDAVAVEIPAPVNLNETSQPVRWVFKGIMRSNGTANQLSDMVRLTTDQPDAFNRQITGQTLQNPLGVYDPLGVSQVQQTQLGDPNAGLDRAPNGTLTASATRIHIRGGNVSTMPRSGYARIESDPPSSTGSTTAPSTGSANQPLIEYISYNNNGNPIGGTLDNVRRGLSFPGSTGAHEHVIGQSRPTLTFIAPRELQPLGLTSQGLVTIESGSSVADAAGRQGAQQFRRVVAQAVPQEQLLEMRWEKQSHYHALLVQRHGSLMNAFPKAYQRQFDVEPDNQGQTNPSNRDLSTGVRPATLRTLLTSSHLGSNWRNGHAWSRSFSMEQAGDDPLTMGDMEYGQTGSSYNANNLTPEGLLLSGAVLSYNVFDQPGNGIRNGFFSHPLTTSFSPPINGRQFGLWIKPNSVLSADVTLFDMRSPIGNAGRRFARKQPWLPLDQMDGGIDGREDGDSLYQNRITLVYEHQTRQLVLTIANGAIEHTEDHGPVVPSETFKFPAGGMMFAPPAPLESPYVDPRSLGNEPLLPPGILAGVNPIGAKRPFNLVQHRYQLDRTNGLKPNQWHQIQVGFVGNDPGHMAIVVNGIVGRNMSKALATSTAMTMEHGDHLTLPSLVLADALTAPTPHPRPNPFLTGHADQGSLLVVPAIRLKALAVDPLTGQLTSGAAAVAALLPKRGSIRIDDEYISYDDIQGDLLMNCLRARRQDSIVGLPMGPDRFPQLQPHLAGALVVPGGIRYNPGPGRSGHLWKGGCQLTDPLPNGMPLETPMGAGMGIGNFNVWAKLTRPPAINPMTGTPWIQDTDTTIAVNGGALMEWPSRGYAVMRLTNEVIYYDNGAPLGASMGILQNVQRGQLGTTPASITWPTNPADVMDYNIALISFEVTGSTTNNYEVPSVPPRPEDPARLVQILDAQTGRIEWISYNQIETSKGPHFFLAGRGFNGNIFTFNHLRRADGHRARERTAFAGTDLQGAPLFTRGSRVIPVQTTLDRANLLLTGDVLTIVPKRPGGASAMNARPYQICVRYAATDGVHVSTAGARPPDGNIWDTRNPYFAFTEALPENWPDDTFEMMSWPAWSGNDLSSYAAVTSNVRLPAFSMPLAAAFTANYALGSSPQFVIGGNDTNRPFLQPSNPALFDGVIDALYAGEQVGGTARNSDAPEDNTIIRLGTDTGDRDNNPRFASNEVWLPAGALQSIIVQSSNDIFHNHDLGMMQIGGEVFAYERQYNPNGSPHTRAARIIGRGLFGSKAVEHRGQEPVMILPIGPVARLIRNVGATEDEVRISPRTNKYHDRDELNAPAVMLCSPDGTKMELIGMPNRQTAPWLRGMYNTKDQGGWTGSTSTTGTANDTLVIGWWPRYPSGIHNQQTWPKAPPERSALLRCRMYAWMGFPIRFHDTWLTGGNGLMDVELLDDGQGTYSVFASALEEGFDWNTAANSSFAITASGNAQDASAIFARFQRKSVDGVEVRVRWEYVLPPADSTQNSGGANTNGAVVFLDRVATAGNTAPMIGKVRLRARAPAKILQVEDAR